MNETAELVPAGGAPQLTMLQLSDAPTGVPESGTDVGALSEGYVSVTPLQLGLTAYRALSDVSTWKWQEEN